MVEAPSALKMQMKFAASKGSLGIRIFEHQGDSKTEYGDLQDVTIGELKFNGNVIKAKNLLNTWHTHLPTEYTRDGVGVTAQFILPAELDELNEVD